MAHREIFGAGIRLDKSGPDDVDIQAQGDPGSDNSFILEVQPNDAVPAQIRYNDNTNEWQARTAGGAFAPIASSTVTLDSAYNGGGSGLGRTVTVDAGAVELDNRQVSGTVLDLNVGAATVLTGALTGIAMDLRTNVTGGSEDVIGLNISIPATLGTGTRGIVIDSTQSVGTLLEITPVGTVPVAGTLFGMRLDMTGLTSGGGTITEGMRIDIPEEEGILDAIRIDTGQTQGQGMRIRQTGQTLVGDYTAILLNFAGLLTGGNEWHGIEIVGSNTATSGDTLIRAEAGHDSGSWMILEAASGATLTGDISGLDIDMDTNLTPGANTVRGLNVTVPAGPIGFVLTGVIGTSTRYQLGETLVVTVNDMDFNVESDTGNLVDIGYDAAVSLSGDIVGVDLDMDTNITQGANDITGINIDVNGAPAGQANNGITVTESGDSTGIFSAYDVNLVAPTTAPGSSQGILINTTGAPAASTFSIGAVLNMTAGAGSTTGINISETGTNTGFFDGVAIVQSSTVSGAGTSTGVRIDQFGVTNSVGAGAVIGLLVTMAPVDGRGVVVGMDGSFSEGTLSETTTFGATPTIGAGGAIWNDFVFTGADAATNSAPLTAIQITDLATSGSPDARILDIKETGSSTSVFFADGDLVLGDSGMSGTEKLRVVSTTADYQLGDSLIVTVDDMDFDLQTTAGTGMDLGFETGTTLTGDATGLVVDMVTDLTLGGNSATGIVIDNQVGEIALDIQETGTTTAVFQGDGVLVLGGSAPAATEQLRVVGDARVEGKLTVTGLIDPTGLVIVEQTTVPGGAPSAGDGTIWIRDDAPNVLVFTDDAGTDHVVPQAQAVTYTPTNVVTDRSYDADATTVDELADVLGTLISDLQAALLIG